MNLHTLIEYLYSFSPVIYDLQLNFFNGNHFEILKKELRNIPHDTVFEIGCGTAPILKVFKPRNYVGIDIEEKFINLARKLHKENNYKFISGDGRNVIIKNNFDIVLFSHTTHHLTDLEIIDLLQRIKKYNFKHLVIYDGRPTGILSPILTKLDYGAAKFRDVKDFITLINKDYKINYTKTFMSNRPFYKYQLLILSKVK